MPVRSLLQAVGLGMLVMLAGTVPRNILFAANVRLFTAIPWAVPVIGIYSWFFWRYLRGDGPPDSTRETRRKLLRANSVSLRLWLWALLAGVCGLVALVFALRLVNRMLVLPQQQVPDFSNIPRLTLWTLAVMAAPLAGIIEEAAFRGYMQGPIERRYGLLAALLITGTMFAVAHLDFTLILWPYYVAVAVIYGTVTYLADSIWPAIVLHTGGNIYSNFDLLLYGQAEWQASSSPAQLVWTTGPDAAFVRLSIAVVIAIAATVWAYVRFAAAARQE